MKVLFITRKFPPSVGGMEQFAFGLTQTYSGESRVWKWGGVRWHVVWWLPWVAVKLCFGRRADVVHLMDGVLVPLAPFARLYGRKVVVTLHGLELTYPNPIYQWLFRFGLKQVQGVVSVSQATDELLKTFTAARQHTVIGHGVQVPQMTKAQAQELLENRFAIGENKNIILLVGRLVERKGQVWFLERVAEDLLHDPQNYLVIVGDGPDRDRVKAATEKLGGLPGRILVRGRVSDAELSAWYARATVMVMPNLPVKGDAEGFGMVALEAAAHGCPVVASTLEGITDAVIDGVTGLLVPSGKPETFKSAILQITTWPEEKRNEMAMKVVKQFTWKSISEQYQQFFQNLT